MRIGVVYPQTEYETDPGAIKEYAQTVEGLGYTHILVYDHVLGANPERPEGWQGPYNYRNPFLSPLLLYSYMAAYTRQIEFVTGIIILPQRETALFAKQAATLDVLNAGRTRLGLGLGWNEIEYVALNQDFHTRGKRIEEQVELLRKLWTQPLVTFSGRWHTILDAGINPLPIQRPIPIWFGGNSDPVLKRVARMGDGWMPNHRSPEKAEPAFQKLFTYLEQAGRDLQEIGIEPRMRYGEGDPQAWEQEMQAWQELGATHLSLNTMGSGFTTPDAHLSALRRFAEATGIRG
jgi:probable F420-dependent oxidoreductase